MKKGTVIIIYFLFCCTTVFGSNLDSLLQVLKTTKEDTNKVNLLLNIELEYVNHKPDSALYYLDYCKNLIHKINDTSNEYRCYFEYVVIYHVKADFEKAVTYCLLTIDIAKKRKNQQLVAKSYRAIFNLYHNLRKYDLAVKYGIYSIKLSESIGDTLNIAVNYGNLCWLYIDLRQYSKAVYYGEKGIETGKKYNDIKGMLISVNNTALAYRKLNNDTKALQLFEMQLSVAYRENIPRSVHKALANLCIVYSDIGDKVKLNKYTEEYNTFIVKSGVLLNSKDICYGHLINAYNFTFKEEFKDAESEINKGIMIAEKDSLPDPLMDLYQLYSSLKYAEHDFKNGEYYLNKYDSVDQSVFDEELSFYSLNLETKYETQKKENEILKQQQQLKKRKFWNVFLIGSIIVLSLLSFLFFRYFKQRNVLLEKEKIIQEQKITELEKEKQLEATDAILKIQEEERSRIAKDLHDGLGGLLSGVKYSLNNMKENVILSSENALSFERTVDMLDSGIQELRRVAHNMMPENLVKFGLDTALKDYCSSITKTNALQINYSSFGMENYNAEMNVKVTVYRVIQELINNIMKHANATESIVQLSNENQLLHITVEDNGKGFDVKNINNFKGAGWSNIQNRIAYLKGTINIDSNEKNGTSVIIEIPLS